MTVKDFINFIEKLRIPDDDYRYEINGNQVTLYDLNELKDKYIKIIKLRIENNILNKEDIYCGIEPIDDVESVDYDIEIPYKCSYNIIIFNIILQ